MVHIGGFNNNRHQVKLHMEQPLLVSWPMNNHWWTNFKRDQSGWTRFRYRLWLHDTPFEPVAVTRFGMEAATQLLIGPLVDRQPGLEQRTTTAPVHLEPEGMLFALEPAHVRLIGCQLTADEIIVRLQEFAGKTADYTLALAGKQVATGSIQPYRYETIRLSRS